MLRDEFANSEKVKNFHKIIEKNFKKDPRFFEEGTFDFIFENQNEQICRQIKVSKLYGKGDVHYEYMYSFKYPKENLMRIQGYKETYANCGSTIETFSIFWDGSESFLKLKNRLKREIVEKTGEYYQSYADKNLRF